MRSNRSNKGFTLIELLIVIAIIGILAAVLIPNLMGARRAANDRAGEAYMRNVLTAAQAELATDIDLNAVETDCTGGYTPATDSDYEVGEWDQIVTCTVAADGTSVEATWTGGNANGGSLP